MTASLQDRLTVKSKLYWKRFCRVHLPVLRICSAGPPHRFPILMCFFLQTPLHNRYSTCSSTATEHAYERRFYHYGAVPSLFAGFRLKSIRSRLCASELKNCGMPSFALQWEEHDAGSRGQDSWIKSARQTGQEWKGANVSGSSRASSVLSRVYGLVHVYNLWTTGGLCTCKILPVGRYPFRCSK